MLTFYMDGLWVSLGLGILLISTKVALCYTKAVHLAACSNAGQFAWSVDISNEELGGSQKQWKYFFVFLTVVMYYVGYGHIFIFPRSMERDDFE